MSRRCEGREAVSGRGAGRADVVQTKGGWCRGEAAAGEGAGCMVRTLARRGAPRFLL